MFERTKQGAVNIILGSEPVDATHAESVATLIDDCMRQPMPRVVFDMALVPKLDGRGLELLLDANDQLQERGGAMKLAAPCQLCSDILRVTGVDRQIDIYKNVATAIRSFAR